MTSRPSTAARVVHVLLGGLTIGLAAATSGCSVTGARSIEWSRAQYNVAIQRTQDEEMLLNLVRLRFSDTPFFLRISSVSTTLELSVSAGADLQIIDGDDLGAVLGVAVRETPVVTYTPLAGEEFVTQMMTPVGLGTILLLSHSGWALERIFRVCVHQLGAIPNAPRASGPTPSKPPQYREFLEIMQLVDELDERGWLDLVRTSDPDAPYALHFGAPSLDEPTTRALVEQLGLKPGRRQYPLLADVVDGGDDRLPIATRSVVASLFYVSQGVDVPDDDEAKGHVTVTRDASGDVFDWDELVGDLFRIRASRSKPASASVRTRYRGTWYYLDDSDLVSERTFQLLMQLVAMQSGEFSGSSPVLTLDVTR